MQKTLAGNKGTNRIPRSGKRLVLSQYIFLPTTNILIIF